MHNSISSIQPTQFTIMLMLELSLFDGSVSGLLTGILWVMGSGVAGSLLSSVVVFVCLFVFWYLCVLLVCFVLL